MLAKSKLNSLEILFSKALSGSMKLKEEIKNLNTLSVN